MSNRILLVPAFTPANDQGSREIGLNIADESNEQDLVYHPQDFELPRAVKSRIDADVQQANAFAITTALFAGALLSLAQLVAQEDARTLPWQTIRFFTYTAISINLTGTTLALVLIKMCSDLESTAQQMVVSIPSSLPARIARGEKLPRHLIMNHYKLLEEFGMSPGYKALDFGAAIWITSGNVSTFVSVIMWVWLAEDKAVAGATMVGTVPAILGLVYAFALTKRR
ncbi:hypothetical protein M408DRAFT_292928 [Serendipita vermifera MAFF 305830]|uniref:Uncharacterized protein n=1 Tax=Serendipita vermifera MAFF 305830 TaxID=933852 RepID=A0A0C3ASA7_SERVB|nr:hypothetical protein M408DRAFT_292928 [Serendipita vermifera MAFF 305830]